MTNDNVMRDRQRPLMKLYRTEPRAAWVVDGASTASDLADPLHGKLRIASNELPFALHSAVGGESDAPVPGDILAAALASCIDSTVRVIANRIGMELTTLSVRVEAEVDVRGTLMVDPAVPVGFQRITAVVDAEAAPGTPDGQLALVLQFAEQCCVVLQTLQRGVPVHVRAKEREKGTEAA